MDFKVSACGCPEIDDSEWDLKEREWDETVFYTRPFFRFFHMPIFSVKKTQKTMKALEEAGLEPAEPGFVLYKDGLFRGAILIAVKQRQAQAEERLFEMRGARVISKVVRGSRRDITAGVSGLLSYIRTKDGVHPSAVYFWKTDCSRCAAPEQPRAVILAVV